MPSNLEQKVDKKKYDAKMDEVFGKNCPTCNIPMDNLQGRHECTKCGYKEKKPLTTNISPAWALQETYAFSETDREFAARLVKKCTMCKGSGEDPMQQGGLTKVCRVCGGTGTEIPKL